MAGFCVTDVESFEFQSELVAAAEDTASMFHTVNLWRCIADSWLFKE
jgi:hypothetical protein